MENCVRNFLDCCAHCVSCIYCTNDCRPALVTAFVLNTNALDVRNCNEVLPYGFVKTCDIELLTKNCISLTKCVESISCDSAKASYTKTRTWEWLTVNHRVWKTECLAYNSNLVLKEKLNRLNKLELKVVRKTANVVVRLNCLLALCLLYAFKNVRINCTLSQEVNALKLSCLFLKNTNKFATDYLTLCFRVANTCKLVKITVSCINIYKVCIELRTKHLDNLLTFALTHKSVVYVNANKLLADSLDKKRCNNAGVNSTRKCQKHLFVANLRSDFGNLLVNKCVCKLESVNSLH